MHGMSESTTPVSDGICEWCKREGPLYVKAFIPHHVKRFCGIPCYKAFNLHIFNPKQYPRPA